MAINILLQEEPRGGTGSEHLAKCCNDTMTRISRITSRQSRVWTISQDMNVRMSLTHSHSPDSHSRLDAATVLLKLLSLMAPE